MAQPNIDSTIAGLIGKIQNHAKTRARENGPADTMSPNQYILSQDSSKSLKYNHENKNRLRKQDSEESAQEKLMNKLQKMGRTRSNKKEFFEKYESIDADGDSSTEKTPMQRGKGSYNNDIMFGQYSKISMPESDIIDESILRTNKNRTNSPDPILKKSI